MTDAEHAALIGRLKDELNNAMRSARDAGLDVKVGVQVDPQPLLVGDQPKRDEYVVSVMMFREVKASSVNLGCPVCSGDFPDNAPMGYVCQRGDCPYLAKGAL